MQLIMRIFLGIRNKKLAENNYCLSEYNHSFRKGYSINKAILEKKLIYNSSIQIGKLIVYVVTDLSACYDRQLTNIVSIVLQSIGVNWHAITLISKILLSFQHQIYTGYRISSESYSNSKDHYGGTGQGNIISREICKAKLCYVIKNIQEKKISIRLQLLITKIK